MTIDGLTLYTCVNELKTTIIGAKVEKVFQPLKEEIGLALRSPSANLRLLISLNAGECRIHLTQVSKTNPAKPPTFCMLLRKYLTSARITGISQVGLERIVKVAFEGRDELGSTRILALNCEFMGKYSNIILTDENEKILGAAKAVPFGVSSVRQVLPGMLYALPPSSKLNPLIVSPETFGELMESSGNRPVAKFLIQTFQGVSTQTADEITARFAPPESPPFSRADQSRFIENCLGFFKDTASGNGPFTIAFDSESNPRFFSAVPYRTQDFTIQKTYPDANAMLDAFYIEKSKIESFNRKKASLNKQLKKALDKLTKKLRIQNDALLGADKAERDRKYGDLIMAHIYQLKRGMDRAVVTDYETEKTVEIPLDTKLPPAANAQKYYKRYNKLKKSAEIHAKYIEETRKELDFLESTLESLNTCETTDELSEVRYDMVKAGYIGEKPGQKASAPTAEASSPHRFTSSDGFVILAGKNNRQNDVLSMKTAAPDDIWMHTQKIPGSHVIIKTNGKSVPERTLFEAAVIAASHSRAKTSTKVPVDYTEKKHIKKPGGAKPGFVIYDHFQTFIVDPDEKLVGKLKSSG